MRIFVFERSTMTVPSSCRISTEDLADVRVGVNPEVLHQALLSYARRASRILGSVAFEIDGYRLERAAVVERVFWIMLDRLASRVDYG
jgi:hypothetical protein